MPQAPSKSAIPRLVRPSPTVRNLVPSTAPLQRARFTVWQLSNRKRTHAQPLKTILLLWLLALAAARSKTQRPGTAAARDRDPLGRGDGLAARRRVHHGQRPRATPTRRPRIRFRSARLLMDKYPVTHEMFAQAQLPNPSHWQDNPKKPVERVRWRDAKRYCNERSLLEGLEALLRREDRPTGIATTRPNGYRLPSEAEWEYAARGGTDGPLRLRAGREASPIRLDAENSDHKTHPVGQKKPTRWGLHDMYGNVSQWCEDVYSPTYYQSSPAADPKGPPSPGKRHNACSAAAIGRPAPRPAARPIARANAPATPTPASAPTTAGSAACAAQPRN